MAKLRGSGVRFLRAQRSTCTENLLRRLIIIMQISDRNRQHIRSVSPSLAVLISAKDVPELWAGGAEISRADQARCCSRTCRNYGLVVLEFRARVRPDVARRRAGIMGRWCWNFARRSGRMLPEDMPELWAGGAGISHTGRVRCCARMCWNYGLVVLEFPTATWYSTHRCCCVLLAHTGVAIRTSRCSVVACLSYRSGGMPLGHPPSSDWRCS